MCGYHVLCGISKGTLRAHKCFWNASHIIGMGGAAGFLVVDTISKGDLEDQDHSGAQTMTSLKKSEIC